MVAYTLCKYVRFKKKKKKKVQDHKKDNPSNKVSHGYI